MIKIPIYSKNNKNTGFQQRKSKRDVNKIKWSEVIVKKLIKNLKSFRGRCCLYAILTLPRHLLELDLEEDSNWAS